MRTIKSMTTFILAIIGTATIACNNSKNSSNLDQETEKVVTPVIEDHTIEDNYAKFRKGKLIEVAFLSIKEGMAKQLKEEYFPKVMPIVMEYGGKPIMTIGVKNNYSENIKAQMVVFFEWPSAAKKEAFEKDSRFIEVKKIRDQALSFLKLSFFKVGEDTSVKLDGSKFYEVYGMSMNRENGHLMQKYFEKAGPLCVNEYGVDFALSMTPVAVNIKGHKQYAPQSFGIAIWPNEAANKKYFGSKEYAEIKHYKEKATDRVDAWQGAVVLK